MKNIEVEIKDNFDRMPNYILKLNNDTLSVQAKILWITAFHYGLYHDNKKNENFFTLSFAKEKLGFSKPTTIKYRKELSSKGFVKLLNSKSNNETIIQIDNECIKNIKDCLEEQKMKSPKYKEVIQVETNTENANNYFNNNNTENKSNTFAFNDDTDIRIIMAAVGAIGGYLNDTEESFYQNREEFIYDYLDGIKSIQEDKHKIIIPIEWLIKYLQEEEIHNRETKIDFLQNTLDKKSKITEGQYEKIMKPILKIDLHINKNINRLSIKTSNGLFAFGYISKEEKDKDDNDEKQAKEKQERERFEMIEHIKSELDRQIKNENMNIRTFADRIQYLKNRGVEQDTINQYQNKFDEFIKIKQEQIKMEKQKEEKQEIKKLTQEEIYDIVSQI